MIHTQKQTGVRRLSSYIYKVMYLTMIKKTVPPVPEGIIRIWERLERKWKGK